MESSYNIFNNNYVDYLKNLIKRFEIKSLQDLSNIIVIQYQSVINFINTNIPLLTNIIDENKFDPNSINNYNFNKSFNYCINFNIESDTSSKLKENINKFTNSITNEINNDNYNMNDIEKNNNIENLNIFNDDNILTNDIYINKKEGNLKNLNLLNLYNF
jgi:hypothetical protein